MQWLKGLLAALRERWEEDQRWAALAIAGGTALFFALLTLPILVRIEWLALDWRFQVREALGQSPIWSPDLVVVAIDEESARHLVVKVPTPRDYLARLVERVAAYRPRVIGIDILLDRPTEAKADWQLAQALRRASKVTKVVLPVQADGEPLLPLYQPLAAATGFADIRPDPDAITRRFRLFRQSDKGWQPSFVAALYRAATGEPASALGIQEPVLINYRHSPSFPSPFPARNFFAASPPPREFFEGKIVLIGVTHADTRDSYFLTPLSRGTGRGRFHFTTGVHIIAHALNTLLTYQFLHEPPFWLVSSIALALSVGTFFGLVRWHPLWGALAALVELSLVILFLTALFIWGAWVFPVTPFLIAIVAGYLGAFLHHFLWTRWVLKAAQERMVLMEKMHALAELAGGITHDVRNLLAPALMSVELLREEVTDTAQRSHLQTIYRAISDAITIVNRLRLFGKPANEQQVLLPVNLNELVLDTVAFTHAKWYHEPRRRGIEIHLQTHLATDLPPVLGNPVELRQVLVNLIFNAVEAMPQGGTLTIRTFADGKDVVIAVQDTGIGISPTVKRRLFEPFFTTKGAQGTGLGLSICYGIVSRHRGTIEVESEEGKGTTFFVRLPAAPAPMAMAENLLAQLPPLRILLIDDDETGSAALAEVLRRAGHKVDVALTGREGLQLYHPNGYEVVIVDWLMPGMNGLEVAKAIREIAPHQPIILTTAWQSPLGDVPKNLVDAVFAKPWTNESLFAALKQALAVRRPASVSKG